MNKWFLSNFYILIFYITSYQKFLVKKARINKFKINKSHMISHVHFCGYPIAVYSSSLYSGCLCAAILTLFEDDNKLCLINKSRFALYFYVSSYYYSWIDWIDLLKAYYFYIFYKLSLSNYVGKANPTRLDWGKGK